MKKYRKKITPKKFEYKPVSYRLKDYTYKEICIRIKVDFDFLKKYVQHKNADFKICENEKLSPEGWQLIKGLYYEKIKQIIHRDRPKSPFKLIKGAGRNRGIRPNFYKLIYTGMTN